MLCSIYFILKLQALPLALTNLILYLVSFRMYYERLFLQLVRSLALALLSDDEVYGSRVL